MSLVPKKGNLGKFRLIMDLSNPRGDSVNSFISREQASVQYKSFDYAVQLWVKQGVSCYLVKADFDSAYCRAPMSHKSLELLGMIIDNWYFIDCCLPFSSASSCAIFKLIASFLNWYMQQLVQEDLSHYLDDFLFCHLLKQCCQFMLNQFRLTCSKLNFPLAESKTEGPHNN